jgi:hypothetical protein
MFRAQLGIDYAPYPDGRHLTESERNSWFKLRKLSNALLIDDSPLAAIRVLKVLQRGLSQWRRMRSPNS